MRGFNESQIMFRNFLEIVLETFQLKTTAPLLRVTNN